MTDPSDAESLNHHKRDADDAAILDAIPRRQVIEHHAVLDMITRHMLFTLSNDMIIYRVEHDVGISDADLDLLVSTAIQTGLVEVLWDDAAGMVIDEDGARTAYPLRLTPLGVEAHTRLDRYLRSR